MFIRCSCVAWVSGHLVLNHRKIWFLPSGPTIKKKNFCVSIFLNFTSQICDADLQMLKNNFYKFGLVSTYQRFIATFWLKSSTFQKKFNKDFGPPGWAILQQLKLPLSSTSEFLAIPGGKSTRRVKKKTQQCQNTWNRAINERP